MSDEYEKLNILQSNMGKAMWQIQALEDTLAHLISMVLNIPEDASIEEAEAILNNTRKKTLGKLINETNKVIHFAKGFDETMATFLDDRNWLVHRCWRENRDILSSDKDNEYRAINLRITGLSSEALKLNKLFSDIITDWVKQKALLKYRKDI